MDAAQIAKDMLDGTALQNVINAYLDGLNSFAGRVVHIATTLATGAISYAVNPLAYNGQWRLPSTAQNVMANISLQGLDVAANTNKITAIMNGLLATFNQPNIDGIPIFSSTETCSRDVEVAEVPLIIQADSSSTQYATDNTNPHPRKFQASGYLMSLLPIDHGLVLKPTILFQRSVLDKMMKSRRPVLYKTSHNEFVKCLITHFDWQQEPNVLNGLKVNVALMEFVALETENFYMGNGKGQTMTEAKVLEALVA